MTLLSAPPSPNVLDVATSMHDKRRAQPHRPGAAAQAPVRSPCHDQGGAQAASDRWRPRPRPRGAGRRSLRSARPPRRGPPGGRGRSWRPTGDGRGGVAAGCAGDRSRPERPVGPGSSPGPEAPWRHAAGPTLRSGTPRPADARTLWAEGEGEPTTAGRHIGAGSPNPVHTPIPTGPTAGRAGAGRTRTSCRAGRAGLRRGRRAIHGARRGPANGRPGWPGPPLRESRGRASGPARRSPRRPCETRHPGPRCQATVPPTPSSSTRGWNPPRSGG